MPNAQTKMVGVYRVQTSWHLRHTHITSRGEQFGTGSLADRHNGRVLQLALN
jgi:hypothetical protein